MTTDGARLTSMSRRELPRPSPRASGSSTRSSTAGAAALTRAQAQAIQTLSAPQWIALWRELPEAARPAALRARAEVDVGLFAHVAAADRFPSAWSALHLDLLARPKRRWHERTSIQRRAVAAPRGNAKSTVVSFLDVLHDLVYGFERFVVVISTTAELAEDLVADLYGALSDAEGYPILHAVWGPFDLRGGKTDFVVRAPGGDPAGTRVWASSLASTIRGKKHAGARPTRILLDDYEHPKHTLSAQQREYAWGFLQRDIDKAGARGTIIDLLGTILHPDAVLSRVIASPAWSSRLWRSIIRWPTRTDLWAQARALWADLSRPDRVESARAFYVAHRADMDAGAEVLWPEGEPLWDLMVLYWADPAAFEQEKQNNPRDPSKAFFRPERFIRCAWDGRTLRTAAGREYGLGQLEIAIWHDRAKGGAANDFPATAIVARDPIGYRHVLEVCMDREPTSGQRARLWRLWGRYRGAARCVVGCDDTAQTEIFAGESWERDRSARRQQGLPWNLEVRSYTLSESKEARIRSMEPDALNGWLQFAETLPAEVIEQFRDFPNAAFDDAPDAIERAVWLVADGSPLVQTYQRG